MTVCDACNLSFDGHDVAYFGPHGATWRLPLERIRVIGEFTLDGAEADHLLAFVLNAEDVWFQAPLHAAGAADVLEQLSRALGSSLMLRLQDGPAPASRVLYPPELAGGELFTAPETRALQPQIAAWVAHP